MKNKRSYHDYKHIDKYMTVDCILSCVEAAKCPPRKRNPDTIAAARCRATNLRHGKIEVDTETYTVRADGQLLTCEPAKELAMAQRYFLF